MAPQLNKSPFGFSIQRLPFLYQTKTIQGPGQGPRRRYKPIRYQHTKDTPSSERYHDEVELSGDSVNPARSGSTPNAVVGIDNLEKLFEQKPKRKPQSHPSKSTSQTPIPPSYPSNSTSHTLNPPSQPSDSTSHTQNPPSHPANSTSHIQNPPSQPADSTSYTQNPPSQPADSTSYTQNPPTYPSNSIPSLTSHPSNSTNHTRILRSCFSDTTRYNRGSASYPSNSTSHLQNSSSHLSNSTGFTRPFTKEKDAHIDHNPLAGFLQNLLKSTGELEHSTKLKRDERLQQEKPNDIGLGIPRASPEGSSNGSIIDQDTRERYSDEGTLPTLSPTTRLNHKDGIKAPMPKPTNGYERVPFPLHLKPPAKTNVDLGGTENYSETPTPPRSTFSRTNDFNHEGDETINEARKNGKVDKSPSSPDGDERIPKVVKLVVKDSESPINSRPFTIRHLAYPRIKREEVIDDTPKAHTPAPVAAPARQLSHSGEHYVNTFRRDKRDWTKQTDLSAEAQTQMAQRKLSRLELEADESESSLKLEVPVDDDETGEREEPEHQRESTITDFERKAFTSLFHDLVKKSDPPAGRTSERKAMPNWSREVQDTQKSTQNEDDDDIFISDSGHNSELNALLRAALDIQSAAKVTDVSNFPRALQDLAADALAAISENEAQADAVLEETRFIKNPVVKKRMDELQRVTARMLNAKTDVELWKVLDEELFSKFRILDLDGIYSTDPAAALMAPRKRRSRLSSKEAGIEPAELVEPAESTTPAELEEVDKASDTPKPDLTILAPNYPLHLLTALRLLTRRMRPSSQLALQILPTLKSLGPSSHILGASTALYNELLRHQWKNLSSLQAVLSTLREMEEDNIPMDAGTFAIVDSITQARWEAVRGLHGEAARGLEEQEWRLRAGVEIHKWKMRWGEMQEQAREEARRQPEDEKAMRDTVFRQWQVMEHPGASGDAALPVAPLPTPKKVKKPRNRLLETFSDSFFEEMAALSAKSKAEKTKASSEPFHVPGESGSVMADEAQPGA